MKRLALISTILVCLASSAFASESWVVNIPIGEDFSRPTGEVRILLGLSAPPTGSQMVVAGTTINLGQTVTVGGDSVRFEAGQGNSVKITYRLLSWFAAPNNFCMINPPTFAPKDVPMRFSGTQDVVDYRISSYRVGAPEIECSQPFKRVSDFPALITPTDDGVAPALTGTFRGRLPLDVVLVLDKSGSMSELPPGAAAGANKAQILRSALTAFVTQWRELDAPLTDPETGMATGIDNPEDRIGVVFFDTTAAGQMTAGAEPPANFFVLRGPAAPTHPWTNINNTINTLAPGGTTSIGGGINEGMRLWSNDADHDLSMVVVTDGKQNAAPLINEDANGILTLTPVSGLSDQLRRRFVPVQTIAFGLPSGVDQQLLEKISTQTNGRTFVAVNADTMFNTFGQTLVSILKGNTVSTVLRRSDTMTGAGPSAPQTLAIDQSVPRVVVSLQWAPPLTDVLDLEVAGPGGTLLSPSSTSRLPQAVILRFDIGPASAGDWSIRVKRAQSPAEQAIPYTLTAFVVEDELAFRVNATPSTIATGDPIRVAVDLAYDGRPLNKLPAGAIRVRVQRPAEGLGTILHDTAATDLGGGTSTTPAGDVQTAYDRKLARLTTPELLARVAPRDVETLPLVEERPGLYSATFDRTTVPGTYAFEVLLDWNDPRTGHVRREERVETHVKVRPAAGTVTVTRRAGDTFAVSVTPRDRFGNYLGPGYDHRVKATLTGAGTISSAPVDPDQTGTYVFTVTDVPAGQTPDVTVNVDGVEVGSTTSAPPVLRAAGRWRASLLIGPNHPLGAFGSRVDGELSITAGLERVLSNDWSLELLLGHHAFEGIRDPSMWELSVGGRRWFASTLGLRPFVAANAGAYHLDPNSDTRAGVAAAVGALFELSADWGIEGALSYHIVNTNGDSATFAATQVGVRFSF